MSGRIEIVATRLREGERWPGVAVRPHEQAGIGEQLERLGVDLDAAGITGASGGDFGGVRAGAAAAQARGEAVGAGELLAGVSG